MTQTSLLVILIILSVLIIATLIKAIIGPKYTDRIVCINCISTMVIVTIIILSVYLDESYLVDVAIIYALFGFTANVVLTRILLHRHQVKNHLGKDTTDFTKAKSRNAYSSNEKLDVAKTNVIESPGTTVIKSKSQIGTLADESSADTNKTQNRFAMRKGGRK